MASVLFALAVSIVVLAAPYQAWDALSFGRWSRRIAETGSFHFTELSSALYYQRPLFLLLQGWAFRVLGVDERVGRALSLAFSLLFVYAVVRLAMRGPLGHLRGPLVLLLILACQDFAIAAVSGLTDVPAAALVAATALAAWDDRGGWWRPVIVGALAAAAGLAKHTAVPALLGLAAALLVGPSTGLWARVLTQVIPILGGIGVTIAFGLAEAWRLHLTPLEFWTAGTTGYSAVAGWSAIVGGAWLGVSLHLLLLVSLVYSVLRLAGQDHRLAAGIAAPTALVASYLGPWFAGGRASLAVGPLASATRPILYALVVLPTFLSRHAPHAMTPTRTEVWRLAVWAAPPTAAWILVASYETRFLAPAWPPLLLLMGIVLASALVGTERRGRVVVVAALAGIALLAVRNLQHVGGLGPRWPALLRAVAANGLDPAAARQALLPSFAEALLAVQQEIGPVGRVSSNDARFHFFYPNPGVVPATERCQDLIGFQVFVLRIKLSGWEEGMGHRVDPVAWAACQAPRLTLLRDAADYLVFRVESAP